jgi:RHS repeat-associated protein
MTDSGRSATNVCFSRPRFTGKERDTESGNDYFGVRYYSSMGRFLSPDPKAASGHAADPQTWNRYAYTDNNPLKFIDPTIFALTIALIGSLIPQNLSE